jgi:hypothetical protein
MKRLTLAAVAALVSWCVAVADETADLGGNLEIWPKDHGTFLFVNAQRTVPEAPFAKVVKRLANDFNIDIRLVSGEAPDVRAVPTRLAELKAKGAIWIVSDPALPIVLAACENGWAFLNVAQVTADSPAQDRVDGRITRLANRLFAYIHGAYDSTMMPQCVLKEAHGMEGIDGLVCKDYSPEAFSKVSGYLAGAGYMQAKRGTYYDACEEGWAPAPTNAVQKAIWDIVHQMPTKPIRIVPESKRRKQNRQ